MKRNQRASTSAPPARRFYSMRCWNSTGAWVSACPGKAGTGFPKRPCAKSNSAIARSLKRAEELQQHGAARRLAGFTSADHGLRHGALDLVPIEIAGGVAIGDPGALHGAKFFRLLVVERAKQLLIILVEQIVPDCRLGAIAIGGGGIGGVGRLVGAGRGDQIE